VCVDKHSHKEECDNHDCYVRNWCPQCKKINERCNGQCPPNNTKDLKQFEYKIVTSITKLIKTQTQKNIVIMLDNNLSVQYFDFTAGNYMILYIKQYIKQHYRLFVTKNRI